MFTVEQALTAIGENPMNEDTIGWTVGAAWVIDGATPLAEPYMVGSVSSASWIAEQISASFRTLSAEVDTVPTAREVMTRTQTEVAGRLRATGLAGTAFPPSASAAYVAAAGDVIDVAIVGDVEVLVTMRDGTVDSLSTNLPDVIVETDAGLMRWGAITDLREQRRAILDDRGLANVLTLAPLRDSAVLTYTLKVQDIQRVLLVSDGFTRLRNLGDPDTLIATARGDISVAQAISTLRAAEHGLVAEPHGKASDDASAVLLSFPGIGLSAATAPPGPR